MNDVYVECLVRAKRSVILIVFKILLIIITVLTGFLGLLGFPFFLFLACAFGGIAYFVHLRSEVEYEYLYLDKEITVDKVMAKSKRKRMGVYKLDKIEILAPENSYHLDAYRKRMVKETDYSGAEERAFVFYYEGGQKIIWSPSEAMIGALRNVAPRKVFSE